MHTWLGRALRSFNIPYGADENLPSTAADVFACRAEFELAGFHGCFASADATHIIWEKCVARLRNQHMGFKESHTYNLTVNHRRQISSAPLAVAPAARTIKPLLFLTAILKPFMTAASSRSHVCLLCASSCLVLISPCTSLLYPTGHHIRAPRKTRWGNRCCSIPRGVDTG